MLDYANADCPYCGQVESIVMAIAEDKEVFVECKSCGKLFAVIIDFEPIIKIYKLEEMKK